MGENITLSWLPSTLLGRKASLAALVEALCLGKWEALAM